MGVVPAPVTLGGVVESCGIVWGERATFQSLAGPHPDTSTMFFKQIFATRVQPIMFCKTLWRDVDEVLFNSVDGFLDLVQVVVPLGQRWLDSIPELSL